MKAYQPKAIFTTLFFPQNLTLHSISFVLISTFIMFYYSCNTSKFQPDLKQSLSMPIYIKRCREKMNISILIVKSFNIYK